jgi:hypothetical protein
MEQIEVINAFRHQRFLHSTLCRVINAFRHQSFCPSVFARQSQPRCFSDQRLSASKIFALEYLDNSGDRCDM